MTDSTEARSISTGIFIRPILEALFRSEVLDCHRDDYRSACAQRSIQRSRDAPSSNWSRRMHMTVGNWKQSPGFESACDSIREILEKTGRIS